MKKYLFVLVIFISSMLIGCASDQAFVKSVDGYTKTILPEYRAYVKGDPNLSDDSKRIRLQSADKFQQLVDEAKEK
jgi:hypothetical protein